MLDLFASPIDLKMGFVLGTKIRELITNEVRQFLSLRCKNWSQNEKTHL